MDIRNPHPRDQWLVDGNPAFGWIPRGTHPQIDADLPIYLYHGERRNYGTSHLEKHRRHWEIFHEVLRNGSGKSAGNQADAICMKIVTRS